MRFYVVEWHHGNEQEGWRESYARRAEAIKRAREVDNGLDNDWYFRPRVVWVLTRTDKRSLMRLAQGALPGTVVWDAASEVPE